MKKSQIAGIVLGGLLAFSTSLTTSTSAEAEELPITSNFGWRYHPIDGQYKLHHISYKHPPFSQILP